MGSNWMTKYNFVNVPIEDVEEENTLVSAVHPWIDDIIFDNAGNIAIGNASLLTGGTLVLSIVCCAICCVC